MKEHLTEIVIGVTGVATTAAAWWFGGRQRNKVEKDDALTRGADQIVDTSNKLLSTLEALLKEERERVTEERTHREMCEASLGEHKRMIDELKRKVNALEKKL
jgi:hypothetical protein